jgi:hypothetical protein
LDVNPADPFVKYAPPSGRLSTVNSGAIYDLAYKNRCKKPDDFLVGIIFACDETKLQKGSKAGSWPLMFTVSILDQKMRNLPIAWKSLGYIFDLSLIQSQAGAWPLLLTPKKREHSTMSLLPLDTTQNVLT